MLRRKLSFGERLLCDSGHASAGRAGGRGKAPPNKGAYSNKPESREQSNNQQRNGQQPPAPPGRPAGQPVATGRGDLTGLRAGVSPPCPLPAPCEVSNSVFWPRTVLFEDAELCSPGCPTQQQRGWRTGTCQTLGLSHTLDEAAAEEGLWDST